MKILLKSVKIFDPASEHHLKDSHVLVADGKIDYIGSTHKSADEVIDCHGAWLSAGWADCWAFSGDPGFENKEDLDSLTESAAAGGFTAVATLPNTLPVTSTKNDIKYQVSRNAERVTEVVPIAAVTQGTDGEDFTEMIDLYHAGARVFSDGKVSLYNSELVSKALQYLQKLDAVLMQRPKDKHLGSGGSVHEGTYSTTLGLTGIPGLAEEMAVQRDIALLRYAGGRLHFTNISSANSVALIKRAQKEGLDVTCSIAAYQPLITDEEMVPFDTNYKVDPPFRSKADNRALLNGLKEGVIGIINSNHMPEDTECKKLEFDLADYGITALQTVPYCISKLSEKVPIENLLVSLTVNPRNILGLEQPKIAPGEVANLTVFDPDREWEFSTTSNRSKSLNSPWMNQTLKGKVLVTMRGEKYYINE